MSGPVLIIGGSSSLGGAIYSFFVDEEPTRDVRVTYSSNKVPNGIHMDFRSFESLRVLEFLTPEWTVFLLASWADPSSVYRNRESARQVNVAGTIACLNVIRASGARVIFSSSVEALAGVNSPQEEVEEAAPLNEYGRTKAEVEAYLRSTFELGSYSVIRTPWIVHLDVSSRCVVKNTYLQLLSSHPARLAEDYLTGLVAGLDVAIMFGRLSRLPELPPTLHLACDSGISRADLGRMIMHYSDFGRLMSFTSCQFDEIPLEEPRARDTRLSNKLARELLQATFVPLEELVSAKVNLLDSSRLELRTH